MDLRETHIGQGGEKRNTLASVAKVKPEFVMEKIRCDAMPDASARVRFSDEL